MTIPTIILVPATVRGPTKDIMNTFDFQNGNHITASLIKVKRNYENTSAISMAYVMVQIVNITFGTSSFVFINRVLETFVHISTVDTSFCCSLWKRLGF